MKAILLFLGVLLAGCGGDGGTQFTEPPTDDEGRHVIEMRPGNVFAPKFAEVQVGDTVIWKHVGAGAQHNSVAEDGTWESDVGDDFVLEITAAMVGDHDYYCEPHRGLGMDGTLRVLPLE